MYLFKSWHSINKDMENHVSQKEPQNTRILKAMSESIFVYKIEA